MIWPSRRCCSALLMLTLFALCPRLLADDPVAFTVTDEPHDRCSGGPCVCFSHRTPNMIGDFFSGYRAGGFGSLELDRLVVIANDLDVPGVLPPGGSTLTLTEAGPVGIFSSSVVNVQQLQQLLRAGSPIPPANSVGTIMDNATMTTTMTISQIQSQLASTPEAFDIVSLVAPPATYDAGVNAAFQARNSVTGTTTYDSAGSGALLQNGADTLNGGEDFDAFYFYTYNLAINVPSPGAGLGPAGRMKVADGNSPLPQNRVYFRYGLFNGVPIAPGGIDLDRFTPGFERALYDDMLSLEMRFPMAASLDSNMVAGPNGFSGDNVEFGNIAIYLKALLHASDRFALSGGLGVTTPTADDINVRLPNNIPLLRVENQSVHLQPFLAGLYTPNDRFFAHGFLQLDVDANGNSLLVDSGSGLTPVGELNDSTFLFVDLGIGYWLHQSSTSCLTGIAPTVELHYNTSLQTADNITVGGITIGNFGNNVETLNLTAGATFAFGDATHLTAGYVTPLSSGADRQLDSGFRVLLDYAPSPR